MLDEALLRLHWLLFKRRRDQRQLRQLLARTALPPGYRRPPVHRVHDINSAEAVELLKRLAPDVCVLMVNVILKEEVFKIPPLGMLVFHPGVTPEYRGPHSAFWATLNNEPWGVGWSLLRVDKGIDTGTVLAQASCASAKPLEDSHVVMQHKSHVDGIPAVVETLRRLAAGESPAVPMLERRSTNYTHPGFSDYLRLRRVLAKMARGEMPAGAPKPRAVA